MKKERQEELVQELFSGEGTTTDIRSALLAVERETVERCAKECDRHGIPGYTPFFFAGATNCAESIRALLTEE